MIPRWLVIADFPFNTYYKVGGIITDDGRNENGYAVFTCKWNEFPNILKRLQWWERREESEMPEYVKMNKDIKTSEIKFGQILKVTEWVIDEGGKDLYFNYENDEKGIGQYPSAFLPATESEYKSQLSKEEKN